MSNKGEGGDRAMSAKERARLLIKQAEEQRAQEAEAGQVAKQESWRSLQDQLREHREYLALQRQELADTLEGLEEIQRADNQGVMNDVLNKLRIDLEQNKLDYIKRIKEAEQAIVTLEAAPLHAEMVAFEVAKQAEAERVRAEEERARVAKQEAQERLVAVEQMRLSLEKFIKEMSSALDNATERAKKIKILHAEIERVRGEAEQVAGQVEMEVADLLNNLPDRQKKAINEVVERAKQIGEVIKVTNPTRYQQPLPKASTLSVWFAAWRPQVRPSWIPLLDGPLRELLAFEDSPIMKKNSALQAKIGKLVPEEAALLAERKAKNIEFIRHLIAIDSRPGAVSNELMTLLTNDKNMDQTWLTEREVELVNLKKGLSLLLHDVGDELYRQWEQSKLFWLFKKRNV